MTAYDRWLDPPDYEEELSGEDDLDLDNEIHKEDGPDGDWGSDEIEIVRGRRYE